MSNNIEDNPNIREMLSISSIKNRLPLGTIVKLSHNVIDLLEPDHDSLQLSSEIGLIIGTWTWNIGTWRTEQHNTRVINYGKDPTRTCGDDDEGYVVYLDGLMFFLFWADYDLKHMTPI